MCNKFMYLKFTCWFYCRIVVIRNDLLLSRCLFCSTFVFQLVEICFKLLNPLAPNDVYIIRTVQLTSKRCILNIYSTNILTEYLKHYAHSPFFSLQDAVYFIMLSFLVPVIFTFYIQGVLQF